MLTSQLCRPFGSIQSLAERHLIHPGAALDPMPSRAINKVSVVCTGTLAQAPKPAASIYLAYQPHAVKRFADRGSFNGHPPTFSIEIPA